MRQECLMHQHFLLAAVFLFSPVLYQNLARTLAYSSQCLVFGDSTLLDTVLVNLVRLIWLARWYDYRTIDWTNYLEYPEFTTKEVNRFLQI